jgi:glycosyltransferase involved in cell wall biosynthesis
MRSVGHPTVSIVIPTFNRAALIARSIQSVLNQSYADFELLVIDDGSTDDTASVVAGFCDPRINYVQLPNNAGAAAALNVGIRMSKGEFLSFQGSDDEWLSDNLVKHMSVFEQSSRKLGVVYSDMHRILKDGSVRYHASPTVVPDRLVNPTTQFYQVYMLGSQSVVMKRDCLDATGYFNEELPALEDLELFIRLSKRFDFYRIPEPLVRYYETDGLSKNRHATLLARKLLVKLYCKELLVCAPLFLLKECLWIYKTKLKFMMETYVRTGKSQQPKPEKRA